MISECKGGILMKTKIALCLFWPAASLAVELHRKREIEESTGLERRTIRLIRHGQLVKRSTYQKIEDFRREYESTNGKRQSP